MVVIREPKTFYFDFGWPKYVNENLKPEIQSLAQNKIKNETKHLMSKNELGNDIHKHRKQRNN